MRPFLNRALAALAAACLLILYSTPAFAAVTSLIYQDQQTAVPVATASAPINVSTATTTQLVALAASQKIYVTNYNIVSGGTGNATLVYGTGSSCGTGTTSLTGAYNLTAQAGLVVGVGIGPVLIVPAGNALCITTSAAVQMSGSVAYAQY